MEMVHPAFIPHPSYEECSVEEMERRAVEFY